MAEAMKAVCDTAVEKGVRLLPAAEPQNANAAVDRWTLDLAEKYNKLEPGKAYVFNTYQCYLKSTPDNLSRHILEAATKGYTMGVKLVRGAYLETESRRLIWDSKADTDSCYDGVADALLHAQWNSHLRSPKGATAKFPEPNLVLATHNRNSVRRAQQTCLDVIGTKQPPPKIFYAQLQGMADEVSCELFQAQASEAKPQVFKCAAWGTTRDCLNYLLRRAAENNDAFGRTRETRQAMGFELWRRARDVFRFG